MAGGFQTDQYWSANVKPGDLGLYESLSLVGDARPTRNLLIRDLSYSRGDSLSDEAKPQGEQRRPQLLRRLYQSTVC